MQMRKMERMGDTVQGVRLHGDPTRRPEPETVRVSFPGGDVDVVRCSDGSYWVHVRVDSEADVRSKAADVAGKLVDARLDVRSKHASECDAGDFAHPDLYHLAVRVAQVKP